MLELAAAVNDLAERARTRRLTPEEVQGGTFTLTNHGTGGSLFALPILVQPQAAQSSPSTFDKILFFYPFNLRISDSRTAWELRP